MILRRNHQPASAFHSHLLAFNSRKNAGRHWLGWKNMIPKWSSCFSCIFVYWYSWVYLSSGFAELKNLSFFKKEMFKSVMGNWSSWLNGWIPQQGLLIQGGEFPFLVLYPEKKPLVYIQVSVEILLGNFRKT